MNFFLIYKRFSLIALMSAVCLTGPNLLAMDYDIPTHSISKKLSIPDRLACTFNKVQDFIESEKQFLQDRVDDLQGRIDKLSELSKSEFSKQVKQMGFSEQAIVKLKAHYGQNLISNKKNLESILFIKRITDLTSLNAAKFILDNKYFDKFGVFIADTNTHLYGDFQEFKSKIGSEFSKRDNPTPEELIQIFNQQLAKDELKEIAEQFVKTMTLSHIFSHYLEARTSFLMSREALKSQGSSVPSTKAKDLEFHDPYDREKAEIALTNFASCSNPLLIIYKAFEKLGLEKPYYYLNEDTKKLYSASPTLISYIQKKKGDILNPDFCLSDVEALKKVKSKYIDTVKLIIDQQVAVVQTPSPTLEASSTQEGSKLSRQQRRQLERKQNKGQKKEAARAPKLAPPQAKRTSPSSAKPKQQPLAAQVQKKQTNQKAEPSVVRTPVPSGATPSLVSSSSTLPPRGEIEVKPSSALPSQLELEVVEKKDVSNTEQKLKPKRWRGDDVSEKRNEEKEIKALMNIFMSHAETINEGISPQRITSQRENLSPQLKLTALATQEKISKDNFDLLELITSNYAKPDNIKRTDFISLMESLGVKVKATTGSIYSFAYQKQTRVMHIHETLGRNVLKRARKVLTVFRFLEQ